MSELMTVLDQRLRPIDTDVLTMSASNAIEALKVTGYSAKVICQGEPPPMPYYEGNWELKPVVDEYTLPFQVQKNINIIRNNHIPIKQILIAHDLTDEKKRREKAKMKALRAEFRAQTIREVVYVVSPFLKVVAAATLGFVAVVGFVVAAFAALSVLWPVAAVIGGLVLMGCGSDPIAIAVLDDERQTWIRLGFWYE